MEQLCKQSWFLGELSDDVAATTLKSNDGMNTFAVYKNPETNLLILATRRNEGVDGFEIRVINFKEGVYQITGQPDAHPDISTAVTRFAETQNLTPAFDGTVATQLVSSMDVPPSYSQADRALQPEVAPLPPIEKSPSESEGNQVIAKAYGIAFRGHRDDWPDVQDDPNGNHGNFLALLNVRIQAGDRVLEEHLKNSTSNALYTSKTVQNELIVICGDIIRNKILAKVLQAKYFSIIADEATDVANDEQLSICIRYVEEADNISDYYKRILTIPMLDHLITELDMRFDKETISIIVECIQLMPSEIVNSNTAISEPDFSNLLKLYGDDLPFSRGLDSEMDMWKIKWTKMPSEANELDTPEKVLRHTDKDFILTFMLSLSSLLHFL
ncbi:hypothetical protein EMCRGX_G001034 [Ephydatia muelleri]